MTQEEIVVILTLIYISSSWVGAILFSVVWSLTHKDRVGLRGERGETSLDRRTARQRYAAAWRNEIVAGVMALAFWMYAIAGTIAVIRLFEIVDLPWAKGLVTTTLLVAGNFIECLIAVALLHARRQMNR